MQKRRLYAALATATLALGAGVATAANPAMAAQGPQSHMNLTGIPIPIGPAFCVPANIVITGQGHDHVVGTPLPPGTPLNVYPPGYHENATVTGDVQLIGTDPVSGMPVVLGTGHGEAWFSIDVNTGGAVTSEDNAHATIDTGPFAGLKILQLGSFTLNANGVPVVNNSSASCS